ncbi:aspartate aminotransferase [Candidatus Photodesmus blepharus]|uniref:Aminotransferase n=1 Tax=Candidatus Photodesmus blepharonis TaxID=1179155 RepID=A0A084CPA4_9GAMM|nr:amino acid aminotransferase [Candidatus Photodesmus blepharus]KEY91633.1 aspartate aminotransferase [Candidatus Photodesmus blepharus]
MFEKILEAKSDSILGLTEEFKKDTRSKKINLSIGIYQNEEGETPILKTVKKAELALLKTQKTKSYLAIEGSSEYAIAVEKLLFGCNSEIIRQKRAKTAQTPGGTAALRIAGEFIKRQLGGIRIWISNPTWANHARIFSASGIEIARYSYYDKQTKEKNFIEMMSDLSKASTGDIVLLQGCCHNPTGIDLTSEEWEQLARFFSQEGLIALFDFAYQGFANKVEEDASSLRIFAKHNTEILVATSFSKNFSLYNERVGAFTLLSINEKIATRAFSQVKNIIRSIYSNPPAHGSSIVTCILNDSDLRLEWENELEEMRNRIQEIRKLFVKTLKMFSANASLNFIKDQNGMFSLSGLSKEQVIDLKEKFSIYILESGRINMASVTKSNIHLVCQGIASVL